MNTSTRSMGHAEGTCTPYRWKRGGPSPEIRDLRAPDVVPLRALRGAKAAPGTARSRGSFPPTGARGTEGHDGPLRSTSVHRRA